MISKVQWVDLILFFCVAGAAGGTAPSGWKTPVWCVAYLLAYIALNTSGIERNTR